MLLQAVRESVHLGESFACAPARAARRPHATDPVRWASSATHSLPSGAAASTSAPHSAASTSTRQSTATRAAATAASTAQQSVPSISQFASQRAGALPSARGLAITAQDPLARHVTVTPKKGLASIPTVPLILGCAGVIPFYALSPPIVAAAAAATTSIPLLHDALTELLPVAQSLQIGYGTAIVSFLGAVHWGAAMQSRTGHTTKIMFERCVPLVVNNNVMCHLL